MRVSHRGGPGSPDPGMWSTENWNLSNLVTYAYGIERYQYSGPSWMDEARFDVQAKVPSGATKEDLKLMVQDLLKERFGLQFHREKKEMPVFELTVAKGGPKLKESVEEAPKDSAAPPAPSGPLKLAADGYPDLGKNFTMAWMNGRARWQDPKGTMAGFASMLAGQLSRPVFDATGLKGTYQMSLFWAAESRGPNADEAEPGPTIYVAIQEQLGLKLEQKQGTVEMLIVDKAEKVPTEN